MCLISPLPSSSEVPSSLLKEITLGACLALSVVLFSVYFPFLLAPYAASKTYHFAFYEYDPDISHFDNSIWTYGTDYFLSLSMAILAATIPTTHSRTSLHAFRSRGLLACYLLSVLAGGLAHQFYTTHTDRKHWTFRLLWTLCVGTVTYASSFMGSIGTQLVRLDHQEGFKWIPLIREPFWWTFGICTTLICVAGGFSFHRPACDIFVAGITQFPSTFYMMAILFKGLPTAKGLTKMERLTGILGFILNAPLLPMYPLLVQYTNMSLAAVNTFLHSWLLVAWGMQGIALRAVERSVAHASGPPPSAVPYKKHA